MNCCRVINNLVLNVSLSAYHMPAGADDFYLSSFMLPSEHIFNGCVPVSSFFRCKWKLVLEKFYLTNIISAKSFIMNIDSSSPFTDENELKISIEAARLAIQRMLS